MRTEKRYSSVEKSLKTEEVNLTVRTTTLLKKLIGIKHTLVTGFEIMFGALYIQVRPTWRKPRCSGCGKVRPIFNTLEPRLWRHLDFGGVRIYLEYRPRRVKCKRCGVVEEKVPWSAEPKSRFTLDFEESVGHLVQCCDKTSVQKVFRITWRTVGRIVERVYKRHRPEDPLEALKNIGVDEVSYRKGHRYLTLVSNHDTGRIVWAKKGKTSDTFAEFFKELGTDRCQKIEIVSMDMGKAYIKTAREYAPQAQIIFDRFHVQRLVSDAVDETRKEEWRQLKSISQDDAKEIKGLRYVLLKNPWNLSAVECDRLSDLPVENMRLYRAYLLKESFASIMDRRQPSVAQRKLQDWLSWASRSKLPAFVEAARTIREHLDDIIAYIRYQITNAVSEGLNNKVRLLTRRAYGFHSSKATIAMIMFCCTGIQLTPVTKTLTY
jgi:transposase